MDEKLVNLIIGALLHDVGKIIYRSGALQSHSKLGWEFLSEISSLFANQDIMECVKYHHGRDLSNANISNDSLAYITYIADNISAAGDRRLDVIEGDDNQDKTGIMFDKTVPLASVFNILNGRNDNYTYKFRMLKDINYPVNHPIQYTTANYAEVKTKIKEQLQGIEVNKNYLNSILHLLEATTSFIPSSTNTKELMDISLFDHSKTTAAIASCLYYYLDSDNYQDRVLKNEKQFREENAFILFTFDISGIQSYIYTISGTQALKALRGRSLYLELLLENITDELLVRTGLSRCNLIYTGGGHAYILLPNIKSVKQILNKFEDELKLWFLQEFDISLFIAGGYAECSSNQLAENIGEVYARVGKNVSIKKSQRYSAQDIQRLNASSGSLKERECRECKRSDKVNDEGICHICQALIEISPQVVREDVFFVVENNQDKKLPYTALPLPFGQILTVKELDEVRGQEYIRVYSKNRPSMGCGFATNIWVGDYTARNSKKSSKYFEDFAKEAIGINRIAVLRADVDNLGKAFIAGFKEQKDGVIVNDSTRKYETISRTATLSRQLSMFFKFYINDILKSRNRNAQIVYSGGDDMFIVGSWNDVIDLAKDIRVAFYQYTHGTLTMSGGIGIYPHSFPISRIATEVGELESAAKTKDNNKNKITLFRKGKIDEKKTVAERDWILEWEQLPSIRINEGGQQNQSEYIEEKLNEIRKVFKNDEQHGKAFLYSMLELIRGVNLDRLKNKINLARYAYLLSRAESRNAKLDVTKFYKWIQNDIDIKELEIAITLYSYETRN